MLRVSWASWIPEYLGYQRYLGYPRWHISWVSPQNFTKKWNCSVHPQAGAFTSWTHFFLHKALLASNADSLWSLSTLTRFSQRKYPENLFQPFPERCQETESGYNTAPANPPKLASPHGHVSIQRRAVVWIYLHLLSSQLRLSYLVTSFVTEPWWSPSIQHLLEEIQ